MNSFYINESLVINEDKNSINNLTENDSINYNDNYCINEFSLKSYYLPSVDDLKSINYDNSKSPNQIEHIDNQSHKSTSHLCPFNSRNKSKRGKKSKGLRKFPHKRTDFDNLQRKVQVHFLTFIINLSNDVLMSVLGRKTHYHFLQIDYDLKKQIRHDFVTKLQSSSIKEIFELKISPQKKPKNEYINFYTLNEVCKKSKLFKNFFNINYLEFFNNFYFNEAKYLDRIYFEGKKIIFSYQTKPFYGLLEKNQDDANLLIENAKIVYFYGYDSLINKNIFTIKNNELKEIQLKE